MRIDKIYPITDQTIPIEEAMKREVAYQNLVNTTRQVMCDKIR